MKIDVRDNQIEPALKALKKQMLKDGLFQEMKRRAHYEKPSVKRKRKQAQARKKRRRALQRARPWDDDEFASAHHAPARDVDRRATEEVGDPPGRIGANAQRSASAGLRVVAHGQRPAVLGRLS